jgi:hypothetical protein
MYLGSCPFADYVAEAGVMDHENMNVYSGYACVSCGLMGLQMGTIIEFVNVLLPPRRTKNEQWLSSHFTDFTN